MHTARTRTALVAHDWVQCKVRQIEKQCRFFRGFAGQQGQQGCSEQVIPTFRCCQLAINLPRPLAAGQPANIIVIPYVFFLPITLPTTSYTHTHTYAHTHDASLYCTTADSSAQSAAVRRLAALLTRRYRILEVLWRQSRACGCSHTSWPSGAASASSNS